MAHEDDGHSHSHSHSHSHDSGGPERHKAHAPASVACYVVTSSDTRDLASDESGRVIVEQLEAGGHVVAGRSLIKDDPAALREVLERLAPEAGARAVVISGGTGIGRRDCAAETLEALFEKRLDGFGELFRTLSFAEIGSAAMLSRAIAGTYRGMVVFALPGSPAAARLALGRLILPELGHAVRELTR